jgi:SAM-dependent methyltransferase
VGDGGWFDEAVAARYDDDSAEMFDPAVLEPAVALLAELAGGGPALEFGIGTGRIALPLRERGVAVSGIELSAAMVERLRAKPGGADVEVVVGDMTTARLGASSYALVYVAWNTIMNLTTQEQQVACFRNAAAHLRSGGRFVVEVMVPQLQRLPPGETARPFLVSDERLGFDTYDVVTQRLVSHHHWKGDDGEWQASSYPFRYVWPAELDLMAQLAGMTLESRWGGWSHEPFTAESTTHVSVYRLV